MTADKPIFLAEDNPRDAELAPAALQEQPISGKVILGHDGAEVLDDLYCRGQFRSKLKENRAFVFLALERRKVNSLEVLRTITADWSLPPIPVVMLTSSREETDPAESYALSATSRIAFQCLAF